MNDDDWFHVLKENLKLSQEQKKDKFLGHVIKHGIPKKYKISIWNYFIGANELETKNEGRGNQDYSQLLNTTPKPIHLDQIKKDVNRTSFPSHYSDEEKVILRQRLINILVAYSNYDPHIGYVQGIFVKNFIIKTF